MKFLTIFFFISLLILSSCHQKTSADKTEAGHDIEILKNENTSDLDIIHGGDAFQNNEAKRLNNEGNEFIKVNEFRKAESKFIAAYRIEPNNPTVLNNLGNIYREIGTEKMARKYFNEALIASDSSYMSAAYNLGLSHFFSKNYQESEDILNYILFNTDDLIWEIQVKLVLTRINIQKHNCQEANDLYQEIKDKLNSYPEFNKQLEKLEKTLADCK